MNNVEAIKKLAVAMNYGSAVTDYTGETTVDVLKEVAVKMGVVESTDRVNGVAIADVLDYIAENYGPEEHEPYDLVVTAGTNTTVTVKRKGKTITPGTDILYNGDVLTITAVGGTGYDIATLTANGTAINSGDTVTVNGGKVTIVSTAAVAKFDLSVDATLCTIAVTKDGSAVTLGTDVLSYGDVLTITATADEGKVMSALTVNGETFTSGETHTVAADVAIVGAAE